MMRHFKPGLRFQKPIGSGYWTRWTAHNHHQHDLNLRSMASRLKTRSVIRFSGPDTVKFLQGLLTNDVTRFDEPSGEQASNLPTPNLPIKTTPPLYAALLTPQGRFLYDFFLYRPAPPYEKLDRTGSQPGDDGGEFELFADVDAKFVDEIVQTFKSYRLRSKVEIENVAEEFFCWQRYGANFSCKASSAEEPDAASIGWGAGVDKTAISATQGSNIGWQWFKDPRLDSLGFRGIFQSSIRPPLVEADKETDDKNYLLWRLENGVAEGSTEIPKGEAIPLEYNLEGLNAISFNKGCYVGQELIARTHHRGVIRKRLLPLKFLDDKGREMEQKVAPGSEVQDTTSGKKIGTVTTTLGCRGLGVLRLEEALNRSKSLTVQGQEDVKVHAVRPDWWPQEWFQEVQQHSAVA